VHLDKRYKSILVSLVCFLGIFSFSTAISAHEPEEGNHPSEMTVEENHDVTLMHEEASHEEAAHGKEKFDAGKMILEHVTNAHSWHLWGHTELALPIIIYNKTKKKWDVFSSAKFDHGHTAYLGYSAYQGKMSNNKGDKFYDFSLTKNGAAAMFSAIILILLMLSVARNYKKRGSASPKGIASFVEPLILFLRDDVIKPAIGKGYTKFLPYMLTLFFFIFVCNLFGLIPIFPGGANITGSVAVTGVLAIITFIITSINGTKDYWTHIFLPPGVPKVLWIILIPIEIVGMFTKPIVLMIRLFANITAGHIIILGFFSLIFIFAEMSQGVGVGVSLFSVAFTVFMSMLEVLVAFLQAYVFTLLTALYIGSARETHEHEEAH
jgi:F-type H+-transporting ATPase subunit a